MGIQLLIFRLCVKLCQGGSFLLLGQCGVILDAIQRFFKAVLQTFQPGGGVFESQKRLDLCQEALCLGIHFLQSGAQPFENGEGGLQLLLAALQLHQLILQLRLGGDQLCLLVVQLRLACRSLAGKGILAGFQLLFGFFHLGLGIFQLFSGIRQLL